jgi:TRAP transporter TAXI family solute receptor
LDAGSWVVGEGHGSLKELEATNPIQLIPLCDDEVAKVTEKFPYYSPHTIKAGVYSTVTADVSTIALWNVVLVKADFPEDLAYEVVQALYDNSDMLSAVYQPGEPYLVPATYVNAPITLHPGALKFALENAVELPAAVRP